MDIEGLGEAAVEQLVGLGLLGNYADIYSLEKHKNTLIGLDRWGEKSVTNLLAAIEKSKKQPFHRILFAMGIRHVGAGVAQALAAGFPSIDALQSASAEELQSVHAIGPRIAESIAHFFSEKHNREMVKKLKHAGVTLSAPLATTPGKLTGKTFVLTGTLPTCSREEAKRLIEEHGGKVAPGVSKNVHAVLAGEEAGAKLAKAKQLGIPIIDEAAFRDMIR